MFIENIIKYGLIIVTYKIWWPILKTLWGELQAALWREGGIIGRTPTERELQVLEEKFGHVESPLINESYAEFKHREERLEEERLWKQRNPEGDFDEVFRGGRSDVMQPASRQGAPAQRGFGAPAQQSGFPSASGGSSAPGAPASNPSAPRTGF